MPPPSFFRIYSRLVEHFLTKFCSFNQSWSKVLANWSTFLLVRRPPSRIFSDLEFWFLILSWNRFVGDYSCVSPSSSLNAATWQNYLLRIFSFWDRLLLIIVYIFLVWRLASRCLPPSHLPSVSVCSKCSSLSTIYLRTMEDCKVLNSRWQSFGFSGAHNEQNSHWRKQS